MVTVTLGVKIKTLLVPSKNRKKISGFSCMVSTVMLKVAVTVEIPVLICNSFVVAFLVAFVGSVV